MNDKLSPEFRVRIQHLAGSVQVDAIVVPSIKGSGLKKNRSQLHRQASIGRVRRAVRVAVNEIGCVLHQFGGKQLKANAIGTISVTTTVEGIRAIARLPSVSAVLENMHITALPGMKPSEG